jgi:hypothetical protein
MIAPTLCAWCEQPIGRNVQVATVIPGDNELRLFHDTCWREILDEVFARENEKIFRRKN